MEFQKKLQQMGIQGPPLIVIFIFILYINIAAVEASHDVPFTRTSFPAGFLFGAGSSAYQSEGASTQDGRGPCIWDHFLPGNIEDYRNASVADDFYNRYKEDIKLMKDIGMESFRLSISWSRVLPKGRIGEGVNQLGINFYSNLINELLSRGIQPFVTLWFWDVPQALEDEYGGVLSINFVNDFRDYADLCFREFGDRVKLWVTLNEPHLFAHYGYASGIAAPGRCSKYIRICTAGNSATEPYVVQHHLLLAHASAVKLYRNRYQSWQKGKIGITVVGMWVVPKFETAACRDAASRSLDFTFGWSINPIVYGEYPESMQSLVGNRLPKFTKAESEMVKGSFDFLGVNYYTANYVQDNNLSSSNLSYTTDDHVTLTFTKNGVPIGEPTGLTWIHMYPKGIEDLLLYVKEKYNNPPIYITENGLADICTLPVEQLLRDSLRIKYLLDHLIHVLKAMKKGVDVRGYYVWSLMDDYEWMGGYSSRFGFIYVDFENGLRRYLKDSAVWYHNFLQPGNTSTSTSSVLYSDH